MSCKASCTIRMGGRASVPTMVGQLLVGLIVASLFAGSWAYADTVLAVGIRNIADHTQAGPLVMRLGEGESEWSEIELPIAYGAHLNGVLFSSPENAWAFGTQAEKVLVLRSADGGQSWTDVSDRVQVPIGRELRIASMHFTSANTGWIVARSPRGFGPFVARSADGGRTWSPLEARSPGFVGPLRLLTRGARAHLLRAGSTGVAIESLETSEAAIALQGTDAFQPRNAVSTGEEAWIVGSSADDDPWLQFRPAVRRLTSNGQLREEPVALESPAQLVALSVASDLTGVAGGVIIGHTMTPVLLRRTAEATWIPSRLPGGLEGMLVRAVVAGPSGHAWALLNRNGSAGTAVLVSDDGARTWTRMVTAHDESARLESLAIGE